ncbi:MAG: hemin uptake protein HemP [Gammaproteobacteria bacterium]|nr:hemin uptake protein HemP [Gammaproteobacteria bacterium]
MRIILITIWPSMKDQDENQKRGPLEGDARRDWRSEELLSGAKEISILHNEERYKLRLTANNKLILTK